MTDLIYITTRAIISHFYNASELQLNIRMWPFSSVSTQLYITPVFNGDFLNAVVKTWLISTFVSKLYLCTLYFFACFNWFIIKTFLFVFKYNIWSHEHIFKRYRLYITKPWDPNLIKTFECDYVLADVSEILVPSITCTNMLHYQ